jgi:hypothetical protein
LRFDDVSRWSILVEVIDALKAVLAAPIPLPQLIKRGRFIALALRVERRQRPLQLRRIRELLG